MMWSSGANFSSFGQKLKMQIPLAWNISKYRFCQFFIKNLIGRNFDRQIFDGLNYSLGEIYVTSSLSIGDNFITFARWKVLPNKSKSVFRWSKNEWKSHLDKFWLSKLAKTLTGENFVKKLFVRQNFRHFSENSSLSPDKVSPVIEGSY